MQGFLSKHLAMEYKTIWEKELVEKGNGVSLMGILSSKWFALMSDRSAIFRSCLIQRYEVPIYRLQYGIKRVQVDDEDWKVKWNLVPITSADNLALLSWWAILNSVFEL